jgi:acyl dehydratase
VLYYEHIVVGNRIVGDDRYKVSADEIKSFAGEWDPMPFHVDEELAKQSPLGRLFASSIHTVGIAVRMSHRLQSEAMAVVAGLGWDEVRFPLPVCAGDCLRVEAQVISKRESVSKPDRGICVNQLSVFNQQGQLVVEIKIASLVLKRSPLCALGRLSSDEA